MQASARHNLNDIDLLWFSDLLTSIIKPFLEWCRYELFVSSRVMLRRGCESEQQLVPVNLPCMQTTASTSFFPGQTLL